MYCVRSRLGNDRPLPCCCICCSSMKWHCRHPIKPVRVNAAGHSRRGADCARWRQLRHNRCGDERIDCLKSGDLNWMVNWLPDERMAPQTANYRHRMRLSGRDVGVRVGGWSNTQREGFFFLFFLSLPPQIQSVTEEMCFLLNERPLCCLAALPLIAELQPVTSGWTEVFLIALSRGAGLALARSRGQCWDINDEYTLVHACWKCELSGPVFSGGDGAAQLFKTLHTSASLALCLQSPVETDYLLGGLRGRSHNLTGDVVTDQEAESLVT